MKTAEEILLNHFGCNHPAPLCNGYGIDLTQQEIIKNAMKAYASHIIDRCSEVARTRINDEFTSVIVDKQSILKVKQELK